MPIITMTVNIIYDGDLHRLFTRNVSCVPRVGEFLETDHGIQAVRKVTYDYDDQAQTLVNVLLDDDAL